MNSRATLVTATALAIAMLAACQPVMPVTPTPAPAEETASSAPTAIVLPDGTTCLWAGEGATLAFDGERANYTCGQTGEDEVVLLGDPQIDGDVWTVTRGVVTHGSDGFELKEFAALTMLIVQVDLATGEQCLFAGEGATLAFDGKRVDYTCGTQDDKEIDLLDGLQPGDVPGVYLAERAIIAHNAGGFNLEESAVVPAASITGAEE